MFGSIGVLAGVTLLIVLALRGVNVIVASILCALFVAVTNGMSLDSAMSEQYASALFGFSRKLFFLFVTGSMFGRLVAESEAATSVAYAMSRRVSPERTLILTFAVCALLTYGGVNVFIAIFTMYPLGLSLMQQANIPKRLWAASMALGAGTFTMTAFPGTPSIHNALMADAMGTPLTAAPITGITAAIIMTVLGLTYLERQRVAARAKGEIFVAAPSDVIADAPDPDDMPHWGISLAPLGAVLATIVTPLVLKTVLPPAAGSDGLYGRLLGFASDRALDWTCIAMVGGILAGLVLFRKHLEHPLQVLGKGAEAAILPLFYTASVIGFGGVVKATPVFEKFAHLMLDTNINPLVSAAISINIMSGIVGSASGGLGIFTTTLADRYLEAGVSPAVLHRIVTIGAGGLDSLPHCGAVFTTFTVMGITHKEAYKDYAVITVAIPLVTVAILIAALLFLGVT